MRKGKGHIPQRMCVVCRLKQDKKNLVRFVLDPEGRLIRDDTGKEPGRGIYVCPSNSCLEQMSSKKFVSRLRALCSRRGKRFSGTVGNSNSKSLSTCDQGVNTQAQEG
ncbi:MAG: YlxR family protein [Deltaproteobacteria bacterium]|nr:YlxR family protein [Deltaproteobacteria bacterium]MBW1918987.1 YlxR family protein [Deltaproteobacteria bacterium]MBW1935005.1 YlxR family protein [Deltaproteobacteria bacterium]MBW1977050.1 YlxR family protein [Deltaproteobacteria bacterium]MBW2045070.1 YlxR family protein [Deltaproteobacteria bacterium]